MFALQLACILIGAVLVVLIPGPTTLRSIPKMTSTFFTMLFLAGAFRTRPAGRAFALAASLFGGVLLTLVVHRLFSSTSWDVQNAPPPAPTPAARTPAGVDRARRVAMTPAQPNAPPGNVTVAIFPYLGLSLGRGMRVTAVEPGGPAARAGLTPDDVLIAVGTRTIEHTPPRFMIESMRGAPGVPVDLTVRRGDTQTLKVTLIHEVPTRQPSPR